MADTRLEDIVEQAVRRHCHDRIRMLAIEQHGSLIIVHGWADSYYAKQLALEGALRVLAGSGHQLHVAIQVT
jgi:hypothetical protein